MAQKQFMLMQKYKKCQARRTVPASKPNTETKIRTDHLVACGATAEMAEPGMNPVE